MALSMYLCGRMIGQGAFGQAWLYTHKTTGKKHVIKKMKMTSVDMIKAAKCEYKHLSSLSHPYIVEYTECFEEFIYMYLVMEFCEGGDLANFITKRKTAGNSIPEDQILTWTCEMCLGLEYLHGNNTIHRDLKPQNIFLTLQKHVKIGDFGIARDLNPGEVALTVIGTPLYISPEIRAQQPYDNKVDVWSLGCCVYELVALKPAVDTIKLMVSGQYVIFPLPKGQYSSDLVSFIGSMLNVDPTKRPAVAKLLQTEIMRKTKQKMETANGSAVSDGKPAHTTAPAAAVAAEPAAAAAASASRAAAERQPVPRVQSAHGVPADQRSRPLSRQPDPMAKGPENPNVPKESSRRTPSGLPSAEVARDPSRNHASPAAANPANGPSASPVVVFGYDKKNNNSPDTVSVTVKYCYTPSKPAQAQIVAVQDLSKNHQKAPSSSGSSTPLLSLPKSVDAPQNRTSVGHVTQLKVFVGEGERVCDLTVLGDKIYVIQYKTPDIAVYNKDFKSVAGRLTVAGLVSPGNIAACPTNSCIYVTDVDKKKVYRVKATQKKNSVTTMEWDLGDEPGGISITPRHGVLVALPGKSSLCEYDTDGHELMNMKLTGVTRPIHAIQLPDENFAMCYGVADGDRGVCVVDRDGKLLSTFTSPPYDVPVRYAYAALAVVRRGHVFVVDPVNGKVFELDDKLMFVADVESPSGDLRNPRAICVDETSGRMYVGLHADSCRIVDFQLRRRRQRSSWAR